MLTKDLLEFRVRKGVIHPQLIAAKGTEAELADALVGIMTSATSTPTTRQEIEAALGAQAAGHRRTRVAKGLVKLLLDRATFEDPDPAAMTSRGEWLARAEAVRTSLAPDADFAAYEAALARELDLDEVRDRLFADLPSRRALIDFKVIDGPGLIARYDLAQVQGLLLYAQHIELRVAEGDTPELRRLLRWMRFCRLVTDVTVDGSDWQLRIEGPAAVVDGTKKYGLQLASFFLVVPTLPRWSITAEVKLPRRPALRLEISERSGLVPGFAGGAGHVPPEMRAVLDKWRDDDWRLDPNPPPLAVGVDGWCVPDLSAHRGAQVVFIELFHAWHRGALPRRRQGLAAKPQPNLLLGVDRKLAEPSDGDAENPQVFRFNGFPTQRGLKKALDAWWTAFGEVTSSRGAC